MRYIILLLVLFIAACGPSQKEKEDVAKVTCAIIDETRNMDSAFRVEKVNDARKQIGAPPFLDGDDEIKSALQSGDCELLVLGNGSYETKQTERADQAEAETKEAVVEAERAEFQALRQALCKGTSDCHHVVDQGGGVLRQPATGLEWTQSDNRADINWNDGRAWCASKGSDWRLPSVDELLSIYDESGSVETSCGGSTCKVSPLFRLTDNLYWSGETNGSSEAWPVSLNYGDRYTGTVTSVYGNRVLCVRRS